MTGSRVTAWSAALWALGLIAYGSLSAALDAAIVAATTDAPAIEVDLRVSSITAELEAAPIDVALRLQLLSVLAELGTYITQRRLADLAAVHDSMQIEVDRALDDGSAATRPGRRHPATPPRGAR